MNGPISWLHESWIHARRIRVLARHFAELIPPRATVLDIGCGDGKLAASIQALRPDVEITGIDVLVRAGTAIPVQPFDGLTIPMATNSVETAILIDVLHHTDAPAQLLAEAARVATKQVVIKDHYRRGFAAYQTLKLMDGVGNARHGVAIPCNYLRADEWDDLFRATGLLRMECRERLGLYAPPLSWLFERSLHFIAALEKER